MAAAVANPDKLRDLAKQLKAAGAQLEAVRNRTIKALQATGWDDPERQRFEQALTADLKAIVALAQRLQRDYPTTLERKARALDDYYRR